MEGKQLGNYHIVEQLGAGEMGVVYVGRHETLGRAVAVKVLQPELSRNAEMVQRFFKEAQAATAIRNPGMVHIFDFGTSPDGRAFIVMELLEGESLAARLRQRRLDPVECCRIGRQAANVLHAAHAAGITHRDLKPDNLFLVRDPEVIGGERVKVLDFGLAKLAGDAHAAGIKTRTGLMMGSPSYMSPEQCRSLRTADARSDVYALGCILFEMACGRPPFLGHGIGDLVGAHLHVPPPHPQSLAPNLPAELSALIAQMLEKPPDARPQSMAAISQALDEILRSLGAAPARPSVPLPMRLPSAPPFPPVAVTLPPDSMTAQPTTPARPGAQSPARAPTPSPARAATGSPVHHSPSPARAPTPLPNYAPTRLPPDATLLDPQLPSEPATMVLSDPTLIPVSESTPPEPTIAEPTMMPVSEPTFANPTLMPISEPTMAEPTIMPVSEPPPPPFTRASTPLPVPPVSSPPARAPTPPPISNDAPSPSPRAQTAWPVPPSSLAAPPRPARAKTPWPVPPEVPLSLEAPTWSDSQSSSAATPFANRAGTSRPPPDVAALQHAFVRVGLIVVAAVVLIAIAIALGSSSSPGRKVSYDSITDAPLPPDAAAPANTSATAPPSTR